MRITKSHIPNIVTSVRIAGAVFLVFSELFSPLYFTIYTVCGVSDVLDGLLARHWKLQSGSGAVLDSIADLLFYGVSIIRIFPYLLNHLPFWIWIGVAFILVVRTASYLTAGIRYHRFASMHTYANKLTGACVFAIPYLSVWTGTPLYICLFGCFAGAVASLEELIVHLTSKRYNPDFKSVFIRARASGGAKAQNAENA